MTSPLALLRRVTEGARSALGRALLGVSAEEIRYTFGDVRAELRATRAELLQEIAALRAQVDRLADRDVEWREAALDQECETR